MRLKRWNIAYCLVIDNDNHDDDADSDSDDNDDDDDEEVVTSTWAIFWAEAPWGNSVTHVGVIVGVGSFFRGLHWIIFSQIFRMQLT